LRGDRAFIVQLAPAVNGCKHILEDLQTLLAKYEGLSSGNKAVNPTRKLWHKIRFSSKIQALGEVRGKIVFYTTTISVLLDGMQLRATGRLEDKLDATSTAMMDAFQSMKLAMVEEALKAKAVSRRQSTSSLLSLSTYNEDDKEVWREFRHQLISKGFKSSQLDKYSDMLQAYLLKLEQSGVLDEMEIPGSASQEKHVFHTFADISLGLHPIEEEHQLTAVPPTHQELHVGSPASQHAGSGSASPQNREQETPTASAFIIPGTSTFLHTMISHAVSQGPEALWQALDLYPQLLKDPFLDATISSEPMPAVSYSLQTIVATAVQQTSVFCLEEDGSACKLRSISDVNTIFINPHTISSTGAKLLALCVRRHDAKEEHDDTTVWRAYLFSMFSAATAEEVFEEVARIKTNLISTSAALFAIKYNWLYEGWIRDQVLESLHTAIVPILGQTFFNLCKKLAYAESVTRSDMADFWTIGAEKNEKFKELIRSQFDALERANSAGERSNRFEATTETKTTEDITMSTTKGTDSGRVSHHLCKVVLTMFRSARGTTSTKRRLFFCARPHMFSM
jgi:hypothetical protein